MLIAFLLGLLAVMATIAVIVVSVLSGKWLKNFVSDKLKNRKKHKVAFADTREIVDEFLAEEADAAKEISMEDLEKMCRDTPYISAIINSDTGEITDYEGIKPSEITAKFKAGMKQQNGMVIIGE